MTDDTDNGWKLYKVSDFAEVVGGGTPSTKDQTNFGEDIPWITPKDLSTHQSRYIARGERSLSTKGLVGSSAKRLPAGTVLVSSRAPIGITAIAQNEVSTNQGCRSLILNPDLADSEFVYYLMAASTDYLHQHANGTTFMELSGGVFKNLEFMLPPLDDQRRIAEVLGALDDRMDAAARLTEILLNEAHAIYDVRAAGESAQVVRVGDIVSALDKGVSYKGAGLAEEGPWLVNLANFSAVGRFKREGTKHYTLPVRPQHRVSPGDLVIANTDLTQDRVILGQPALIPPGAQDASVTHHVYAVRFAPEHAVYRLPLYFALRSQDFQDRSYLFGSGTTVAGLSRDAVLDYTCAMPPKGELPALTAELATRLEAVWRLEAEIDELRRTRDFLLPRLVSGELRVAAAEQQVEAAT
jgi:type I restriction enzyme S subunit